MQGRPFHDETQNPGRKTAFQNTQCFNSYQCFLAAVPNMKMRWRVVIVVHRDDRAKEPANLWHRSSLGSELCIAFVGKRIYYPIILSLSRAEKTLQQPVGSHPWPSRDVSLERTPMTTRRQYQLDCTSVSALDDFRSSRDRFARQPPCSARSNVNSPPTWSTFTPLPSANSRLRISTASGFWIRCWITRFSGRAPKVGS